MRELFFCFLMVGALASQSLAADQPTRADVDAMDCTQAVEWVAKEIIRQQPPDTLPLEWKPGQAETTAIRVLSQIPNSPCFRSEGGLE